MSEFCWDCMIEIWEMDGQENDFAGIPFPQWVLCEGCGEMIFVDTNGKKIEGETNA